MVASLFEVEVRNRVMKGGLKSHKQLDELGREVPLDKNDDRRGRKFELKRKFRRIKGTQGNWYREKLYYLAESEGEARQLATEDVAKRRVLGIPKHTKRRIQRQVEVLATRRLE